MDRCIECNRASVAYKCMNCSELVCLGEGYEGRCLDVHAFACAQRQEVHAEERRQRVIASGGNPSHSFRPWPPEVA